MAGPHPAAPVGPGRMSLNAISTRDAKLADVAAECEKAGIRGIGVWRHHVEELGAEAVRRLCDDHGLRVTSLCRGGWFPADTSRERAARIDDNRRAVADAAALGAEVLVVVSGPVAGGDLEASRGMVGDGLAAVLPDAADAGVILGIEPLHPMFASDRSVIVTLGQGNDLLDRFDGLGLVVDVYHCWWDDRAGAEIARAGDRVVGFHVSDWVTPLGDPLTSRGLPGDGVVDLRGLRAAVEAAGYDGLIEVEVMNPALWALPVEEAVPLLAERFSAHV